MRRQAGGTARTTSITARASGAFTRFGLALLGALCAALLLGVGTAAAAPTFVESFNGSATPDEGMSASLPAVDEATGDVYVIDAANNVVDRFSKSGAYLSQLTIPAGQGVGGEAKFGFREFLEDVAVDDSGGPNQGNIYVVGDQNGGPGLITAFDATGKYLWQRKAEYGPGSDTGGVAVDHNGNLWTADATFGVQQRNPATGATEGLQYGAGNVPTEIAFDSTGVFYLTFFQGPVFKYSPTIAGSESVLDGNGNFDVATDWFNDDVYTDVGSEIHVYDSAGNAKPSFGSGSLKGVTVDGAHGNIFLTNTSEEVEVWSRGTGSPKPYVRTGEDSSGIAVPASGFTGVAATVQGTVNPAESNVSVCEVEYVADAQFEVNGFASASKQACVLPLPGAGNGQVEVEAHLTGLTAGTEYHYRLLATNANGTTKGSARDFVSLAPRSLTVWVSGHGSVGASPAPLSGAIAGCTETGGSCEGEYEAGSTVTLTATPESSAYVFAGWVGCRKASASTCEVTLDAATEVTAVFLKEGVVGAPGSNGSNGTNGKDGANGAGGTAGPKGDTGATGPQGKEGPAAKVTCKVKGQKKPKVTCTVKQSASASRVHWRLSRAGHTYRRGTAAHGRLHLGALPPGHYRLHLEGRKGATSIVVG